MPFRNALSITDKSFTLMLFSLEETLFSRASMPDLARTYSRFSTTDKTRSTRSSTLMESLLNLTFNKT